MSAYKCDVCGKFRSGADLQDTGNEYETWTECTSCMSPFDLERHEAARTTTNGDA